jgi:hypothetical protein
MDGGGIAGGVQGGGALQGNGRAVDLHLYEDIQVVFRQGTDVAGLSGCTAG